MTDKGNWRHILRAMAAALLVAVIAFASSCGGKYGDCAESSAGLPPIFPDYTGVTVPPNIAPLNFEIKGAEHIKAIISIGTTEAIIAEGKQAVEIDPKEWKAALGKAMGKDMSVSVMAWTPQHPKGIKYKRFKISVSRDSIDPWIAYRLIPPGYELWNRMGIFQRHIEGFEQEAIVKNSENDGGCVNCHSFNAYNPRNWMFHARGKGGGTMLTLNGKTRKIAMEELGPHKSATYPFWHPSGKYIAFTSNTTRQSFYGISQNKIEVYDLDSDFMIYDVDHNRILTDPRFCGSKEWETFPAFSPDGKSLYLCVARLDIPDQERQKLQSYFGQLRYSIIRVPFDAATGKLGAKVDTIYNAWREGGSVSFPRISPNGRFMMFTKADCATFPIQHTEADLKMIDLTTDQPVSTDMLNSPRTESYHSWSSNGAWVMFSSKRIDGCYTRLFFAHCDKDGKFTKPFMLPQRDPEQNTALLYAYNIPEFIKAKVEMDKEETAKMFQ